VELHRLVAEVVAVVAEDILWEGKQLLSLNTWPHLLCHLAPQKQYQVWIYHYLI
jgi:hypothetical protein